MGREAPKYSLLSWAFKERKEKGKEPGRKEPRELHVSPVPKCHQDYGRQVGNACRVLL